MLFNYHFLKNYVAWEGTVESLSDLLTQLGFEVEEVHAPDPVCAGLKVGLLLGKDPHPKADRLTLCQVDVGEPTPRQIVCGATNHSVGDKVVVALTGQELPGGMTIEKREVRGVSSEGMMCSAREIGLGTAHDGIIILPPDARVGDSAIPYLTSIDLNVTPNRPDCLGWIGIAREIAAATEKPLRIPEVGFQSTSEETIPIILEDPEGCPRYLGRIIRDVKIGPSPKWLSDALEQVGLGTINNVVDATNFVLMEYGHPLHAFDLDKLGGPEIRVRRAQQGETMVAINHQSYSLGPEQLVIADQSRPVALAGVMGGVASEVTSETTNILLECAYFNPSRIRRSGKPLGLSSDASFRFERGTDAICLQNAMDRCVALILEIAGGRVTSPVIEAVDHACMPKRTRIILRPDRASRTVGAPLAAGMQASLLTRLGCEVTDLDNGQLRVEPPTFRSDLVREIDLVEELARHFGYGEIPSAPPEMPMKVGEIHPSFRMDQAVRQILSGRGWTETKSFSFSPPDLTGKLNIPEDHPLRHSVPIANPITEETAHLRTTLLGSLLDNLQRNVQRGEKALRIFEWGKVYLRDIEDLLRCERYALGLALLGTQALHWSASPRESDFYDMVGACQVLFAELGAVDAALETYACDYFHPGQAARWVANGQPIGIVGRAHPNVSRKYDLPSDPILAEIDIAALMAAAQTFQLALQTPSQYPPIRRDLSLTVSKTTTAREMLHLIEENRPPYLEEVALFDRYTGLQIGEGFQSLGFRLTYRSAEKTLTEEEITPLHMGLLRTLKERVGAVQRGQSTEGGGG